MPAEAVGVSVLIETISQNGAAETRAERDVSFGSREDAKAQRNFFYRGDAETRSYGPGGAGPYRRFVKVKVNVNGNLGVR